MSEHLSVYVFRDPRFARGRDTIVCAAPHDLVVSVFGGCGMVGEGGLVAAFGGAALFRNDDTGCSYLGVWGARKASRFRSALRRSGALVIVRDAPPARLVWFQSRENAFAERGSP